MRKVLRFTVFYFNMLIILVQGSLNGYAQEINSYGLAVVSSMKDYRAEVAPDSNRELLNIAAAIPGIMLDIRYATDDNFLGFPFYDTAMAFARRPVVEALGKVEEELAADSLGLKIYDAYRPYSVTVMLYEKTHDSVFVAVPWKGSRHNRGCAIDLTLIDSRTGKELPMPTPYDDFTEKAHPDYADLPADAISNRDRLIALMDKYGFTVYYAEWWHFDFRGWEKYSLLDIPFDSVISGF